MKSPSSDVAYAESNWCCPEIDIRGNFVPVSLEEDTVVTDNRTTIARTATFRLDHRCFWALWVHAGGPNCHLMVDCVKFRFKMRSEGGWHHLLHFCTFCLSNNPSDLNRGLWVGYHPDDHLIFPRANGNLTYRTWWISDRWGITWIHSLCAQGWELGFATRIFRTFGRMLYLLVMYVGDSNLRMGNLVGYWTIRECHRANWNWIKGKVPKWLPRKVNLTKWPFMFRNCKNGPLSNPFHWHTDCVPSEI
jgi:hypothetical protein